MGNLYSALASPHRKEVLLPPVAVRRGAAVLLAAASCFVLGCGGAKVGKPFSQSTAKAHLKPSAPVAKAPVAKPHSVTARVDASSDAALAEGKVKVAAGAPSDAEVRREIKLLKKEGIVLPSGDSIESFTRSSPDAGAEANAERPEAVWNPRQKPIADWIVPILQWAYLHGWRGAVTSGYRTYYEQAQLNAAGDFSAPAGSSNHETTVYPGGAVDVTQPGQLIAVLKAYPGQPKLVGGVLGAVDPEHFSATGD